MSLIADELIVSRAGSSGENPTVDLQYTVQGTDDDKTARIAVEAAAPVTYDLYGDALIILARESVYLEPDGPNGWKATVRYSIIPQEYESSFSFDTGGGIQHITQSLETVGVYAPGGATAPDFKGAIGVTADAVEGVDITVPVYQFNEVYYWPDAFIDAAYKAALYYLTGRVNQDPWRWFAAEEVLFLGAAGGKRGTGPWEIQYRFAASANATSLQIGDITGISKKGWEYLWMRYADKEDTAAKALVKQPIAAYVERVYKRGDFTLLGIGA